MFIQKRNQRFTKGHHEAIAQWVVHWRFLLGAALALFAASFFLISGMQKRLLMREGIALSLADCFVIADNAVVGGIKCFALVPLFLCFIMIVTARDNGVQYILRRNKKATIWAHICVKAFGSALAFSTIAALMVLLCGTLLTDIPCNWHEKGTLFWLSVGEALGAQVPAWTVGLHYWLNTFLMLFVSGIAFLLCNWIFSQKIIAWMLLMGLCFVECFGYAQVFFAKFSIAYELWRGGYSVYPTLIYAVFAAGALFAIGLLEGRRKEFYG